VLNGPQLSRGPQFADHWRTVLLVNNLISHWCKVMGFHWTTLIQTPDITGAGYEYDFTWFILWKAAILFLYSERIQHRPTTVAYLTVVQECESAPCLTKFNESGLHLAYISVFNIPLVFSRLHFLAFFGCFFDTFPMISGISIKVHIRIHFNFSFFSECWQGGPRRWSVGLLQLHYPLWMKQPSYATGVQLNFPG